MKKRIKLTDEEIAIGMWVYIYLKISESKADIRSSVCGWKEDYLILHRKEQSWRNNCLFCERYFNLQECRCPLSEDGLDCGEGSIYATVHLYCVDESHREQALEACKKIIKAFQEEEEKNEVENGKERE